MLLLVRDALRVLEVVVRVPALLDVDEVARVRLEVAQKVEGQRAPLAGVPVVEEHIGVVCDRGRGAKYQPIYER